MTDIVRWLRDSQHYNEKLRTTVSGASEAAEFYQRAADEIERLRVDVEQRLLVLEAKNTRIDALSSELAHAREVLLEMDKIVAGHVAEVDRLREANKVLEAELRVTKALASQTLGEIGTDYRDLRALNAEMLAALKAVVAVADQKTVEFDAARAAIAKSESQS